MNRTIVANDRVIMERLIHSRDDQGRTMSNVVIHQPLVESDDDDDIKEFLLESLASQTEDYDEREQVAPSEFDPEGRVVAFH